MKLPPLLVAKEKKPVPVFCSFCKKPTPVLYQKNIKGVVMGVCATCHQKL